MLRRSIVNLSPPNLSKIGFQPACRKVRGLFFVQRGKARHIPVIPSN